VRNKKTDEISEAAIGLVFISSEYRLIFNRNIIKIGATSLLILASAVENGLLSLNCTCRSLKIGH
jgi:hypothetical protein